MGNLLVEQKQIVLISYPYSDLVGTKVRPGLVVSGNSLNKKSKDCILVPLTTVMKDEPYSVTISQDNLEEGKLIKTSRARVDKIFSVEKNLIRKTIGIMNDDSFSILKSKLLAVFD